MVELPLVLPKEYTGVFSVASLGQARYMDILTRTVKATPLPAGPAVELVIPNKPGTTRGPDPVDETYKPLQDAGKHVLLRIKFSKATPRSPGVVSLVEPYELRPGEDEPGVFVFSLMITQELPSGKILPVLVVTKYCQETTAIITNKRGSDGRWESDPAAMAVIDGLKEGDSVEVKLSGRSLKSIARYVSPRRVELINTVMDKAGVHASGIKVKDGKKDATYLVNPKEPGVKTLATRLGTFKPGQAILIRTREENGRTCLIDAREAPKEGATQEASDSP